MRRTIKYHDPAGLLPDDDARLNFAGAFNAEQGWLIEYDVGLDRIESLRNQIGQANVVILHEPSTREY